MLVRRVNYMIFSLAKRRRGKPKRTLEEISKGDLRLNNSFETLILILPNDIV